MNIFMVSLGGKVEGANIEVHDVQFVVAEQIEDTIDRLKDKWYGKIEKLHIDSYRKILGADGYEVKLTKERPNHSQRLFFGQIGGYDDIHSMQEMHRLVLVVAKTEKEAKEKIKQDDMLYKEKGHVDEIVDVEEKLLQIDNENYYIELVKSKETFDICPEWYGFKRIDI